MPSDEPAGGRRFVEQCRAKGNCRRPKNSTSDFQQARVFGKVAHNRNRENVPGAGATSLPLCLRKLACEGKDLNRTKNVWENCVAVLMNKLGRIGRNSLRVQRCETKTVRGFSFRGCREYFQ